jgi:hypothetical protein
MLLLVALFPLSVIFLALKDLGKGSGQQIKDFMTAMFFAILGAISLFVVLMILYPWWQDYKTLGLTWR